MKIKKHEMMVLYDELKKINLSDFIERELKVSFKKSRGRFSCLCPMPFHKDSKPSFHVFKSDDYSECWMYHCFGCGSSGTIIDFCMNYWSLEYPSDAVVFLIDRLNIKETYEIVVNAIRDARVESSFKKRLDGEHFLTSKKCYKILKSCGGDEKTTQFIFDIYRRMNEALCAEDIKKIELISGEVLKFEHERRLAVGV